MAGASQLFHPLCGSNASTLFRLLTSNGPLAVNRIPHVLAALTAVMVRSPFSLAERMAVPFLRRRHAPMLPPVFIVGFWRSGTTHLHNVLSQATQFGHISPLAAGLPWDLMGIVRALRPLLELALPSDRYVDNVRVTPDSPQEDSIPLSNMLPLSYYHGLYFPNRFAQHFKRGVFFEDCRPGEIEGWSHALRYFLEKVSIEQGGKPLLIKNPVYTGQVARLQAIWPQAKFIHIHRNPYVLLPSTRHFFTRLFPVVALQRYDDVVVDELILESYPRMMRALLRDAEALPATSFVEVRFEDFEAAPMRELERIYRTLELEGIEQMRPRFEAYLMRMRGYRKNQYPIDHADTSLVEQHWQGIIERFGYTRPDGLEPRTARLDASSTG